MNVFDDIDDKIHAFESLFHTIIDQHAPLKQAHVRGGQEPYLTDEWRKAIRHRNHLWKVFARNGTDANYSLYKLHRNKCTSLRRKAIISYFRKKSLPQDQEPRHFWTTFRPFLHSRKSQQANSVFLSENDRVITDKQSIANIFNKHFLWILQATSRNLKVIVVLILKIILAFLRSYQTFLKMRAQTLISHFSTLSLLSNVYKKFQWTSLVAMIILLHGFSRTLLLSYLVPYVLSSIHQLFRVVIQTTGRRIKQHRFFKKDDDFSKTNYGPISVLPPIKNVFEKLLTTQLNLHFNGILADNLSAYRKHHSYSIVTSCWRLEGLPGQRSYDSSNINRSFESFWQLTAQQGGFPKGMF